ncbi:uncharacterized protein LOC115041594 [Echeneis naucrates]|uniref:Uncharacterized LOC115041594 n=1 Tax=Echeneis naucrates TaxID=173247 RepID=A0A665T808_ECHNA|nr:uncharacterized protein LOC115041594 [Echeneis naucrates]
MVELQEALRAWQKTEGTDGDKRSAENQPYREISTNKANFCTQHAPTMYCGDFQRCKETDTQQSSASSLERNNHQSSAGVETCAEARMHSVRRDSCIKGIETHLCGANNIDSGNISGVHGISEELDEFHLPGNTIPATWQKRPEQNLLRAGVDRKNSRPSCSSSPHPCSGTVPVICHSSRAATLQLAEVSSVPPYHPVSQLSVICSRSAVPTSQIKDVVQDVATNHRTQEEVQTQDNKNNKKHTETQIWGHQNVSDQFIIQDVCSKSGTDHCDTVEQDYNSSSRNDFIQQNDQPMDNGSSHITDHNDRHAHCELFQQQNRKEHSVSENVVCNDFIRGFNKQTELSFDDVHSVRQSVDRCTPAAAEALSSDSRTVVPLPMQDSGNDSPCEYFRSEGGTKDEHSYSIRCLSGINSSVRKPETSWDRNTQDSVFSQHENELDNSDTVMKDERLSADVSLPMCSTQEPSLGNITRGLAFERYTSLEMERMTDSEITEPHSTFTMPVDSGLSAGQLYHGHLHYHCLPQEDSDHKRSHLGQTDHTEQSSKDEEEENFSSPAHRKHVAKRTRDQVLLLDISTKPAELLTTHKHKSDKQNKRDTSGTGVRSITKRQKTEATSAAAASKRTNLAELKFCDKYFDEISHTRLSEVVDTNFGEGKEHSRLRADLRDAGVMEEVCNPKEDENCSIALTACSCLASSSSTLSLCIAHSLSVSTPTNVSSHLSTPLHQPFQCSLCDRSFSQRGSLNRHVRSHLGVRPFPCPCCPMTFSRQYRVTEHMRVHQRCTLGIDFHKPPTSSI